MNYQDYEKFVYNRNHYGLPQLNLALVEKKKNELQKAKYYQYKEGEAEEIALKRFERALKMRDLSEFPNVTYFHKKKLFERE